MQHAMEPATVLQSKAPAAAAGQTLSAWLARRFRYLDEAQWVEQIAEGRVTVAGRPAVASQVLQPGEVIAYRPAAAEPPADLAIRIVGDAVGFCVVDKPAHLVSHADGAFVQNTFVRVLERELRRRGQDPRLSLAHRLDRETSGLLLVAKTRAAARAFERQFTGGRVQKEYLAIVRGVVAMDCLTLDQPIGRHPGSTIAIRRAVVASDAPQAQPAITEVSVLQRLPEATLVRCVPATGRTHQIRVHLEHAGHPLLGDKLYGRSDDEYLEFVRHVKAGGDAAFGSRFGAGRQMLHAARLAFDDPRSGERRSFTSPLPDDMQRFLAERAPPA
jgi:23S rRNA pseudouridine1911/1915/1917 synthase